MLSSSKSSMDLRSMICSKSSGCNSCIVILPKLIGFFSQFWSIDWRYWWKDSIVGSELPWLGTEHHNQTTAGTSLDGRTKHSFNRNNAREEGGREGGRLQLNTKSERKYLLDISELFSPQPSQLCLPSSAPLQTLSDLQGVQLCCCSPTVKLTACCQTFYNFQWYRC